MTRIYRTVAKTLTLIGALALAPAMAVADADAAGSTVIGKLRLVKNGEEMALGRGPLANPAKLTLVDTATQRRQRVQVGDGGAFSWQLAPGQYRLAGIDFLVRGERVSAQSNFMLTVPSEATATYVGTVTLEATFAPGYYGLAGAVDRHFVSDDCVTDCAPMLSDLGLSTDAVTVALLRPRVELLTRRP